MKPEVLISASYSSCCGSFLSSFAFSSEATVIKLCRESQNLVKVGQKTSVTSHKETLAVTLFSQ